MTYDISYYVCRIADEALIWQSKGWRKYNSKGAKGYLDIDQWIAAGRPECWSPIITAMFNAWELGMKDNTVEFQLQTLLELLERERIKKEAK